MIAVTGSSASMNVGKPMVPSWVPYLRILFANIRLTALPWNRILCSFPRNFRVVIAIQNSYPKFFKISLAAIGTLGVNVSVLTASMNRSLRETCPETDVGSRYSPKSTAHSRPMHKFFFFWDNNGIRVARGHHRFFRRASSELSSRSLSGNSLVQ